MVDLVLGVDLRFFERFHATLLDLLGGVLRQGQGLPMPPSTLAADHQGFQPRARVAAAAAVGAERSSGMRAVAAPTPSAGTTKMLGLSWPAPAPPLAATAQSGALQPDFGVIGDGRRSCAGQAPVPPTAVLTPPLPQAAGAHEATWGWGAPPAAAPSPPNTDNAAEHVCWAWDMDAALRRRVQEHTAALAAEKERTAAAEERALVWEARVGVLEERVLQLARALQLEQGRAEAGWARAVALEGFVQASLLLQQPKQFPDDEAKDGGAASIDGALEGFVHPQPHHIRQQQLEQQAVLELRERCKLAEDVLTVYRRMVESSQDALLLLRRTGSAALDDLAGANIGPVVVFANVAAAGVLKAAPGHVMHGPLLVHLQSCDWGATLHAFAQALAACPNTNEKQLTLLSSRAATATGVLTPVPRRLALRLHDGEKVVASFSPTDEEDTVLCVLARRGAAPHKV